MKWATGRLYRNRKLVLTISGMVIPILLYALLLNERTLVAGLFQRVFYSPFLYVSNKFHALIDVYDQNVSLKSEIVRLKFDRLDWDRERNETNRFRAMLDLPPKSGFRMIPADVVAHDQGRRWTSIVIKSVEPVGRFLPVVDERGLVGKTSSSTGDIATVSLLTGPNCRVAARDNNTRTLGIVKWRSGRGIFFEDVAMEFEVYVGDTVVSSGMGGIFPEGLLIGTVKTVDTVATQIFKEIELKPFVNFGALDNVMVLKPTSGSFGY